MVGSLNYWDKTIDGQVSTCIAPRQGGSSVKVFNYITAIEHGFGPDSNVVDVKTAFGRGQRLSPLVQMEVINIYNGPVTLREAVSSSRNVPAVKLLQRVGVESIAVDIALGYAALANDGFSVGEPVPLQDRQLGMRGYEPVCVL